MLAEVTGLHPQHQKLIFKDKERESNSFLDVSGVKEGSRIVLIQDIISLEKKLQESRRNSNMDLALKSVTQITMEVDKLVCQVIPFFVFHFKNLFKMEFFIWLT